jgi:regulator of cell morphogenesis and NO signaling
MTVVPHGAATLGDLVVATPGAAALFERLGIDYCCGGARTLDAACREHGIDAGTVRAMLEVMGAQNAAENAGVHDLSNASFRELCEHIVVRHHGPLRVALTRISKLMETIVRVHGAARSDLGELQDVFAALRSDLEAHLRLEEDTLFPACAGLDGGVVTLLPDDELLEHLRDDHQSVGSALRRIRELCGDYDEALALCGTHREVLRSLRSFELDLHQHVHEENNVLFPRVLAVLGSST